MFKIVNGEGKFLRSGPQKDRYANYPSDFGPIGRLWMNRVAVTNAIKASFTRYNAGTSMQRWYSVLEIPDDIEIIEYELVEKARYNAKEWYASQP